jgi:hypothetical protein
MILTDKVLVEMVSRVNRIRFDEAAKKQQVSHNESVPIPLTIGDVMIVLSVFARMEKEIHPRQ